MGCDRVALAPQHAEQCVPPPGLCGEGLACNSSRAERDAVYGMTSSAMFLGNSLGPLLGGAIAASFGLHWVFLMTAIVMTANLFWVYRRVPGSIEPARQQRA